MQTIVEDFPPNYEALVAAFPIEGKRVIFSYGDVIYNPHKILVPRFLRVHEEVHGRRQMEDIPGWWEQYIADPDFRLAEELMAHAVEQEYRLAHAFNRKERRSILAQTAERLASPIYGPVVGRKKARKLLAELGAK